MKVLSILGCFCLLSFSNAGKEDHHPESGTHSICSAKVDVGFVIDASGSMKYHYTRLVKLVGLIHDELAAHIKDLKAGTLTFSDKVILYRTLRHYYARYFNTFLKRMAFQGRITRLDKAFDFALKKYFLVLKGHRPGAQRVLIVITDGRPTKEKGIPDRIDALLETIEHIKEDGIHLIMIGAVDSDKEVLEKIDAGMNQLLYAGALKSMTDKMFNIIPHHCRELVCNIEYSPKLPSCPQNVDLIFVVDSSGSLRGYFDAEKYFVKRLAEQFDISKHDSRVGFVRFSHIVETEVHLKDFNDMHAFHDAVDDIFYDGGLTRIDLGLKNAEVELRHISAERMSDPGIRQMIILLTDGRQEDRDPNPAIVAKKIRDMGVQIIVIGVGKTTDIGQMKEIAGPGIKVYTHETFDELINPHNIERLIGISCRGVEKEEGEDEENEDEDEDHDHKK